MRAQFLRHRQVVWEVARTDDLDAVVEDEQADRCADQVVPVHQGVDQQFLKDYRRDLGDVGADASHNTRVEGGVLNPFWTSWVCEINT